MVIITLPLSFNKINQPEFFSKMVQELNLITKNQGDLPSKDMLMGFRSLLVFVLSGLKEEVIQSYSDLSESIIKIQVGIRGNCKHCA